MTRFLSALVLTSALALPAVSAPALAAPPLFSGVPIEAIVMRSGSTASKIAALDEVPSIGVVRIRQFRGSFHDDGGYDEFDYRLLISRNQTGINKLRRALKANPATRRALESRGISVSRVIGVDVYSNGSIRVYLF
jgi:hypothetical protein